MIISNVATTKGKYHTTLSADITFKNKPTEKAYISIDKKYNNFISADASPFLAAILIPCIKSGEDIYVDGSVSPQFLKNTSKIIKLLLSWKIGFHSIKIKVKEVTAATAKPKAHASFFTAGVDSFYTYLKHAKGKNKISHLVLVHGFDIPLSNKTFFNEVKNTIQNIAKKEKIEAIFLTTNIGEIIEKRLIWDFAHGGALGATALFLRNGIKSVLIPSAVRNDQLFPYGTHPQLDSLWSSENQTVKSEGGEYDRLGKVIHVVGKSSLALQYLRVCTQNLKGKYNCSRCYKCLLTMIYLAGANVLHKSKTFENTLSIDAVKNMYYDYDLKYNIQGEMALTLLKKKNLYPELQEAIAYSLEKSKHPKITKKITKSIAQFDQKYNDRRLYRMIFMMTQNNDRNIFFKFLFKKGLLK